MATRKWDDLLAEVQQDWSEDAWRVYHATAAAFTVEMDQRAQLGEQIAQARKAHGLTQAELARMTDTQQAEISRIERGLGNPTAVTLHRLANALQQPLVLVPTRS